MQLIGKCDIPKQDGTRKGAIVLYHAPENGHAQYITWWEAEEAVPGFPLDRCRGHYHVEREAAIQDFAERVQTHCV